LVLSSPMLVTCVPPTLPLTLIGLTVPPHLAGKLPRSPSFQDRGGTEEGREAGAQHGREGAEDGWNGDGRTRCVLLLFFRRPFPVPVLVGADLIPILVPSTGVGVGKKVRLASFSSPSLLPLMLISLPFFLRRPTSKLNSDPEPSNSSARSKPSSTRRTLWCVFSLSLLSLRRSSPPFSRRTPVSSFPTRMGRSRLGRDTDTRTEGTK
jgi:hypothetical protein